MTIDQMQTDDERSVKALLGGIPDWLDGDRWENKSKEFKHGGATECGWLMDWGQWSPADIASIDEHGAGSNFMPAQVYWSAKAALQSWEDPIFDLIQDSLGEIPAPPNHNSWRGMACFYVSLAVELWAAQAHAELLELDIEPDDDDTADAVITTE